MTLMWSGPEQQWRQSRTYSDHLWARVVWRSAKSEESKSTLMPITTLHNNTALHPNTVQKWFLQWSTLGAAHSSLKQSHHWTRARTGTIVVLFTSTTAKSNVHWKGFSAFFKGKNVQHGTYTQFYLLLKWNNRVQYYVIVLKHYTGFSGKSQYCMSTPHSPPF